jgi:hypothetical protein
MPQSANYDVIVIGTSQGGRFLPATFAKADRKVAVSSAVTWEVSVLTPGALLLRPWLPAHVSPIWRSVVLSTA